MAIMILKTPTFAKTCIISLIFDIEKIWQLTNSINVTYNVSSIWEQDNLGSPKGNLGITHNCPVVVMPLIISLIFDIEKIYNNVLKRVSKDDCLKSFLFGVLKMYVDTKELQYPVQFIIHSIFAFGIATIIFLLAIKSQAGRNMVFGNASGKRNPVRSSQRPATMGTPAQPVPNTSKQNWNHDSEPILFMTLLFQC